MDVDVKILVVAVVAAHVGRSWPTNTLEGGETKSYDRLTAAKVEVAGRDTLSASLVRGRQGHMNVGRWWGRGGVWPRIYAFRRRSLVLPLLCPAPRQRRLPSRGGRQERKDRLCQRRGFWREELPGIAWIGLPGLPGPHLLRRSSPATLVAIAADGVTGCRPYRASVGLRVWVSRLGWPGLDLIHWCCWVGMGGLP